jgi:hypothetical protein
MSISETCLFIGGVANCFVALSRLRAIPTLLNPSFSIPNAAASANRGSLAIVSLRATFLYAFFGVITFAFPQDLLTPVFGIAIGGGIAVYLAFTALEQFRLPEYSRTGWPIACTVGATAYLLAYIF